MFLFELLGNEQHPVYQQLAIENLARQYSFLRSAVVASVGIGHPMLSIEVIKSLNYHAISCLHVSPGEFRPCYVSVGKYEPPGYWQVPALMQMFTNEVNRRWSETDPVMLATYVLWRLNWIHPFVNGNGRTARVSAYFVLCCASGGWLPGKKLLPELLVENRPAYVEALREVDASLIASEFNLAPLHQLMVTLLDQQLAEVEEGPEVPPLGD